MRASERGAERTQNFERDKLWWFGHVLLFLLAKIVNAEIFIHFQISCGNFQIFIIWSDISSWEPYPKIILVQYMPYKSFLRDLAMAANAT